MPVIFRELEGTPTAGRVVQVEYWSEHGYGFPVGLTWVTMGDERPYLEYMIVLDHWRRQGIGEVMLRAILARWPDIDRGEAISDGGKALRRKVPGGYQAA